MIRRLPVKVCFIPGLFSFHSDEDKVSKDSKTAQSIFEQVPENESGWDRLRIMFSQDEFGNPSPELNSTLQTAFMGMFIGACYGGFVRSRLAYMDFMERNDATAFKSHLDAKRKLQDQVTVNFAKGAFQWAWRLALFSGSYVLISTSISVYRGKSSIWEYIIAGGVTGTCYKLSLGPRGMLVGGLLGCCLGTFAGGITLGILKATGMTMEEVRFWQYRWNEARSKQTRTLIKDYIAKDDPLLLAHHNKRIGESGNTLESLESSPQTTKQQ